MNKPRTFTSAEAVIDRLRTEIFASGRPYKAIATDCSISSSTIANIASGKTRWPRHTTLFPLMQALGLKLELTK